MTETTMAKRGRLKRKKPPWLPGAASSLDTFTRNVFDTVSTPS